MMWSDKAFAMYMGEMGDVMAREVDTTTYSRDVTRNVFGLDTNVTRATECVDEPTARRAGWFARTRSAIAGRAQVMRG